MKIAILGQSYPPMISGAALFSCHLAEALAERGHEVLVLAASDMGSPYQQKHGTLRIIRLRSYQNPSRVGQRFLLWPSADILSALGDFSPEIIHLHEPFQMAHFAHLYTQRTGIPCILTIHGLPSLVSSLAPNILGVRDLIDKMLWGYATWAIRRFDSEITPTLTISQYVTDQTGICPHVISGGVNLEVFRNEPLCPILETSLRNELAIPVGAQIILHVGRLDADKNVKAVVRAAAKAIKSISTHNVHLLIVGDGREKSNLIREAKELGIGGHSHFTGYIYDTKKLAAIYRMADLFSTASEVETQGLVLLEAAACGLPIVTVNASANPEIVSHGVNGFLIQPGEVEEMAHYFSTILQNPDLRKRMRIASHEASLNHDFNQTVDAYENHYLTLVQKSNQVSTHQRLYKQIWTI